MLNKKLLIFLLVLSFSTSIVYSADNSTSNDAVNLLEENKSNQNINSDVYEKNKALKNVK